MLWRKLLPKFRFFGETAYVGKISKIPKKFVNKISRNFQQKAMTLYHVMPGGT